MDPDPQHFCGGTVVTVFRIRMAEDDGGGGGVLLDFFKEESESEEELLVNYHLPINSNAQQVDESDQHNVVGVPPDEANSSTPPCDAPAIR
jgi:hypothetical protein